MQFCSMSSPNCRRFQSNDSDSSKSSSGGTTTPRKQKPLASTEFFAWSCRCLAQRVTPQRDPQSARHLEQEYRRITTSAHRRDSVAALRAQAKSESVVFTCGVAVCYK